MKKGLKDHEIAEMISLTVKELNLAIPNLPQSIRILLSKPIVRYLDDRDLRIDHHQQFKGE